MISLGFISVVLAAGEGRRARGFKPLFRLDESTTFLDRIIRSAETVCSEVRVVGGAYFDRLQEHVRTFHPGVLLLRNADWERGGMFSSVQTGLADIASPCFVHPADIPGPSGEVYQILANAWKICKVDVVRPVHNGRLGHSILISPRTAKDVVCASENAILRDVLRGKTRVDVPVPDHSILNDYDTIQDLEAACLLESKNRR